MAVWKIVFGYLDNLIILKNKQKSNINNCHIKRQINSEKHPETVSDILKLSFQTFFFFFVLFLLCGSYLLYIKIKTLINYFILIIYINLLCLLLSHSCLIFLYLL